MVSDQMFTAMKWVSRPSSRFRVAVSGRRTRAELGVSFDQVAAAMATMTSKGYARERRDDIASANLVEIAEARGRLQADVRIDRREGLGLS